MSIPTACPICGSSLEHGFLLGQQAALRWLTTLGGLTVFHGCAVPQRPPGYWWSLRAWVQPPAVAAARCAQCGLGYFDFVEPPVGDSRRDAIVAMALGSFCVLMALVLAVLVALIAYRQPPHFVLALVAIGAFFLILSLGGTVLLIAGSKLFRRGTIAA